MLWFWLSLGTAALWGISYVVSEKLMHDGMSPAFLMLAALVLGIPFYGIYAYLNNEIAPSIEIMKSSPTQGLLLFIASFIFVISNLMILMAVQMKNATLVNMIEITYPIFTIIFTAIFLKKFHLDTSSIAGATLIFAGVFLIFWKQQGQG
jgi:drug/metabolite transporter (DMT)-like permease